MSIQRFLSIIRARWLLIVGIFAAVLATTFIGSMVAPKQYIATANVVVQTDSDPVAGQPNPGQQLPSYLATQLDVVNSDRVALRAVELLKLDQDPQMRAKWQKAALRRGTFKEWLAERLLRNLIVTPSRESNVINIAFRSSKPADAASYANTFAQAYIDTNVQLKVQPAKQYTDWFTDRARALKADWELKQKLLLDYQRANGITPTGTPVGIEDSRLSELSSQLTQAEAQSLDTQSRLHEIEANPDALPEVLQNPVIVNLKSQLSVEQIKSDEMLNRLGPRHPDYMREEAVIMNLRARISQETGRIVRSLSGTAEANVRRASDIRAALEAQEQRLISLQHGEDAEALLENDVINAKRSLDLVNQRLAETSLESQTQQSNVVLLSAAAEPLRPSSPNMRLNMAVAVFLGAILAVACAMVFELWDDRIHGGDELSELLGIPLLGALSARPYQRRIPTHTP